MTSVSYQHFEKLPLSGLRFLVTRQDSTESSLSGMLEAQGALVLTAQMTQIIPTESWKSFDETVQQISNIDWAVFTSRNGVTHCLSRLNDLEISAQQLFSSIKTACVGQATASVLTDNGITPELVPEHFQSEGLIDAFKQHDLFKKRCWLIQAESPRKILRDSLQKMGAQIILTPVYRNVPVVGDYTYLLTELEQQKLDWILFASPSAVQNFHQILPSGFWESLGVEPKIACLGKITAKAVRNFGWSVHAAPNIQDFEHLVQSLCEINSQISENI